MKKDIEIKISRITRSVDLSTKSIGNDGENLQGNLVISFVDEFVNGQARLEYRIDNDEKRYIILKKENQSYVTPISNVITKTGIVNMQLVVTEGVDEDAIPVFKSDIFPLYVGGSINAELIAPDGYDEWIDVANTKLNTIDEAVEEAVEQSAYAKEQGDYAKSVGNKVDTMLENGELHGATFLPNVDNEGNLSWSNDKNLENPATQNIRGPQGVMGPQGEAFKIKKTYSSKTEMVNDFYNMEFGDYVMITSNIEVEDNAKLYSRGEYEWVFITDFSGSTGIQGPQGVQGIQGIQGERGEKGDKPVKGVDYFTQSDIDSMVDTITEDANSEFNRNVDAKTEEYNQNAEEKVEEFNSNIDDIIAQSEDAYNNQIFGLGEGESIHLRDSANARLRVLNIDGNFKQETTTGKNKLDISYLPISEAESLLNGGSYTFDEKTNKITLDATKASGVMTVKSLYSGNSQLLLKAGTYYSQVRFNAKKVSDGTSMQFVEGIVNLEDDVYITQWFITCSVGLTKTIYPQIEPGDSMTSFEKYTGGQASPSPNYPQEIEVDEGIENLFDKDDVNKLNGIPDSNSKTFVASSNAKSFYVLCDSNERYVVSRKIVGSRFTVGTTENIPTDGEPIIDIIVANNSRSITIDTSSNAKFLVVYYLYNSSEDEAEILSSIQIEKKKTHHNYVPFGQWKKIRIMGKNFCNLGNEVTEKNGVAVEYNYNELKINGTTTSGGNITTIRDNINFDGNRLIGTFPAGTYTYTSKLISGSFSRVEGGTFAFYIRNDSNESLFSYGGHFDTIKKFTLTETTALYLQFYSNNENVGGTFDDCVVQIQIEPEETSTNCEPYVENELLINLKGNFIGKINNDIKDKLKISLELDDKKIHAKLSKKVSKAVFDGSDDELWTFDGVLGNVRRYSVDHSSIGISSKPDAISKSSHFINKIIYNLDEVHFYVGTNYTFLFLPSNKITSVNGLRTWLSNNPVTVYYELAEPYEIDLGVVEMPKTYENISNITLISNIDTNMQVEYVKHTKTVIADLQSQIDAINTLLSTTATSAMLLDNYETDLESEVME